MNDNTSIGVYEVTQDSVCRVREKCRDFEGWR